MVCAPSTNANLLPGPTTLTKLFAADWIALDDVRFVRRDYQHRACLATLDEVARNRWLSIPTHRPSGRATLISDSPIADPYAARRRAESIVRQQYGAGPHWSAVDRAREPVWDAFASGRIATVAAASTRALPELLGWQGQILTSSTLFARTGRSERLADLAAGHQCARNICAAPVA